MLCQTEPRKPKERIHGKNTMNSKRFIVKKIGMKRSGINMKKLYNIKLIKKITPESLSNQNIHFTWANVINGSELYTTKGNNSVIILFKRRKEIISLDITKEFAKEHFQIIGSGAINQEGVEISKYINQENDLR